MSGGTEYVVAVGTYHIPHTAHPHTHIQISMHPSAAGRLPASLRAAVDASRRFRVARVWCGRHKRLVLQDSLAPLAATHACTKRWNAPMAAALLLAEHSRLGRLGWALRVDAQLMLMLMDDPLHPVTVQRAHPLPKPNVGGREQFDRPRGRTVHTRYHPPPPSLAPPLTRALAFALAFTLALTLILV